MYTAKVQKCDIPLSQYQWDTRGEVLLCHVQLGHFTSNTCSHVNYFLIKKFFLKRILMAMKSMFKAKFGEKSMQLKNML